MAAKVVKYLFLTVLVLECIAAIGRIGPLHVVAKPSLMPLLIAFFWLETRAAKGNGIYILAALFFSWIGDVVLLADTAIGGLFIYGLIAFLLAHIFYIVFFISIRKLNENKRFLPFFTLTILAYMVIFYLSALPHLGVLAIPVLIYAIVITAMLIASIHAFDLSRHMPGILCVTGAMLFALSDSALAINRFVYRFPLGPFVVMLTYGLAQFFIILGAIRILKSKLA